MEIIVRKTTHDDVLAAEAALDDGRRALAQMDIPQWQGDYPNRIDVADDIEHDRGYVAVDADGAVLGTLAFTMEGEPTYDSIDGAWLTESSSDDATYATIHRCAVAASAARQGVMSAMFDAVESMAREQGAKSVRIDTHRLNVRMRGLAGKRGYTECGVITLPYEHEADPTRIAYEKVLH